MPNFAQVAQRMTPKGWAIVGGSVAAAVVFLVLVMQMASSPSYSTLMAGVDPAQTGKITSTLSGQGIAYQLQNNGTAVAVESDKTAQARVALATAGLLSNQQPGFSLMDNQQLGQSNFQQQVTYERALEGQLASTIETINGVSSAVVNLVLPNSQDELFGNNQPATGSVLLSGSTALDENSVRGIAQLVASSVPGLNVQKVTITDSNGQLLWPTSQAGTGAGGVLSKEAAAQSYDSSMASQLDTMLATTLGAGKAQVNVNANVDANQATSDQLVYAKKGVPLTQQTSVETLKGGNGTGASGVAGTTGTTVPTYAATGSGTASNYKSTTKNTSYAYNKTITHSVIAPGAIQQQSVSVLVDKSVPAAEIPAIKTAVANAIGLQPKRGDQISVAQIQFAKQTTTAPTAAAPSSMMKYAKYGLIGLASVLFLIFASRAVKKREGESLATQPKWLRELEAPRTLASLERGVVSHEGLEPAEIAALRPAVNVARRQVEDLVKRDPDRVAQHVRAWMAED
jgi:flagellar M-ring protein FliF